MIPEPYAKQQFIDDLWFIVRRLRDMKAKAADYGVQSEVASAQSKLAGALGHLEGDKRAEGCPSCSGAGSIEQNGKPVPCGRCGGNG